MTMRKFVVISGASSGIGEACADVFAEQGYRLAIGARRIDKLESLKARLLEKGAPEVYPIVLDVRDEASVQGFVDEVKVAARDGVDILVNNAGLALGVDHVVEGRTEDWQTMLDTNVVGLLRMTRGFLKSMLERGRGHIINMGSIAGHFAYAGGAAYAGTKHAVKAISGALRLELKGSPIRVSSIDPGMVDTEFSKVRLGGDEEKAKSVYQGMTPLSGRDVAECVLFVATRPPHVNIDHIIVMPTDQASITTVHRRP